MVSQKRLDSSAKFGVIAASAVEERGAFRRRGFLQRLEEQLPLARTGWLFGHAHVFLPTNAQTLTQSRQVIAFMIRKLWDYFIAPRNQARAKAQSRSAVRCGIPSAAAASGMFMPAK